MKLTDITTRKVVTGDDRAAALQVVREVYQDEKQWVRDLDREIPPDPSEVENFSWFLALVGDRPVGLIRLWYDFSIELPEELDVTLERPIDLDAARSCRWVEVGRFMIVPEHRKNWKVVMQLMKAAVTEVVDRGYTHFITDVYEGDPHSPLQFHTRVLGFERIGTHRFGELDCDALRIILILDLARAYRRAKDKRNKMFRELAAGLHDKFEKLPKTVDLFR
jgi:hypothetical protein